MTMRTAPLEAGVCPVGSPAGPPWPKLRFGRGGLAAAARGLRDPLGGSPRRRRGPGARFLQNLQEAPRTGISCCERGDSEAQGGLCMRVDSCLPYDPGYPVRLAISVQILATTFGPCRINY